MKSIKLLALSILLFFSCNKDEPGKGKQENLIGLDGGMVTSSDQMVSLEIPANALSNETLITLQTTSDHPADNIGQVYDFGPNGLQFLAPATMSFQYEASDLLVVNSDNNLTIAYDNNNSWEVLNSTVDVTSKTVSAEINHFTSFGLTYNNRIVYGGASYKIVNAEVNDLGMGDPFDPEYNSSPTHYNYEFSIYDRNENIWIDASLYAKNENSFSSGTFVFKDDSSVQPSDVANIDFFFVAQMIVNQNSEDFAATAGTIKVSGDPANKKYSIEYDLTYSNGKTAKGIFTGTFQ